MSSEVDFLIKEYELCFEQLRFYDNRQENLLKYLFTLTTSVATAQFAIYKLIHTTDSRFFIFQSFLSVIVFIASTLLFLSMLQNRLYFVFVAKQINAIRDFFLSTDSADFKNNQLYTSTSFSALKVFSVHTFQMLGAAMLCGLYAGSFSYGLASLSQSYDYKNIYSVTVFIIVSFLFTVGGSIYLFINGRKKADEAIHGEKIA
jgi:hypothetical protein